MAMNAWPLPSDSIHIVDSIQSKEFALLLDALDRAYIVAMDAEWKPLRSNCGRTFPRVSILQVACRMAKEDDDAEDDSLAVGSASSDETNTDQIEECYAEVGSPTLPLLDQNYAKQSSQEEDEQNSSVGFESLCFGLHSNKELCIDGTCCRPQEEQVLVNDGKEFKDVKVGPEADEAAAGKPSFYPNLVDKHAVIINDESHILDVELSTGKKYLELSLFRLQEKEEAIFLLDMLSLPIKSLWEPMKRMLVSTTVLKLGFKFKHDLFNLAKTFPGPDAHSCFDKVDPYVDIGKTFLEVFEWESTHGESVSLATICEQVVGHTLCKDLQCSNWEQRPLTAEQRVYAGADVHCLLVAYDVFESKVTSKGQKLFYECTTTMIAKDGVAEVLQSGLMNAPCRNTNNNVLHARHGVASVMVKAALSMGIVSRADLHTCTVAAHMLFAKKFSERLLLSEQTSKKGSKKKKKLDGKQRVTPFEDCGWIGLPPWDPSCGGDGIPKFVCDDMVGGLAKQLRNVGFDTVQIHSKKSDPRKLVEIAEFDGRVLLTQDIKLLRTRLVPPNLVYRVKCNGKQEQLAEVVKRFKLQIVEDNLLSRCNKCNGNFFPDPLTPEEALLAMREGQVFPDYALREHVLFWQCSKCMHMYWQGKQFHRALQTFQAFARQVQTS